jgi:hypothetical protein
MKRDERKSYSPISSGINGLLRLTSFCTVMPWLALLFPLLRRRSVLERSEIDSAEFTRKRALAIEVYLISWYVLQTSIWLALAAYGTGAPQWLLITGGVLAGSRILEIIRTTLGVVVFDHEEGRVDNRVASSSRTFILTFLNFGELIACFGLIYATRLDWLKDASSYIDALYFSGITQLTIGYGDIQPLGPWKLLTVMQGGLGFLFAVVVVARVVTILPPMSVRFPTPSSGSDEETSDRMMR